MRAQMRTAVFAAPRGATPLFRNNEHVSLICRRWKTKDSRASDQTAATAALSPRWLSDVKQRIGKCITFGLKPYQTEQAGRVLQEITRDWRELVAGSEGYLTGPKRRGMHRQVVLWGEMDSMVCYTLYRGQCVC